MQRITLIPILILVCCSSTPNTTTVESEKEIDFNNVRSEIEWFIEKIKPESFEQGRHNVYAVKIYEVDEGQYCTTIGYIDSSIFVEYVEGFKYYFRFQDDLILIDYSDDFRMKYKFLNTDNIQLLSNKQIIWDKIDKEFETMGTSAGYVCCYEGGNIRKMYYENSDEIPYDKAIFKYIPKSPVIELDSSSLKKIIREKKKIKKADLEDELKKRKESFNKEFEKPGRSN